MTGVLLRAAFCLLLPLPAAAASGHQAPDAPPQDAFASYPIKPAPSFRAFPEEIVAKMRRRILEARGELPPPVSPPERKAHGGH